MSRQQLLDLLTAPAVGLGVRVDVERDLPTERSWPTPT
jgi:hypothetical protein